jgi:CMP-N,N'-diacetyllegionaminic acid synthase
MDRQAGVLAVIPARGGSKSVPRKNLAPVAGQPLIAWTIGAALGCEHVSRTVVSTDDSEIAAVAREYGAEVPFLRPAELSQDDTPGIAPIQHAAAWLHEQEGYRPKWVVCLQPTSPLRTVADIRAALELAWNRGADSVVSVSPVEHHPYWMKQIDAAGRLSNWTGPDCPVTRRQDLPPLHALNGAIYLVRREVLMDKGTFYTEQTLAYIMPPERSLDVDTLWDLKLADLVLRNRGRSETS